MPSDPWHNRQEMAHAMSQGALTYYSQTARRNTGHPLLPAQRNCNGVASPAANVLAGMAATIL
jgi:hypothetical protein